MKTKLILSGFAIMALTVLTFAQNPEAGQKMHKGSGNCPNYVDANKDGVCDNHGNSASANGSGNQGRHKQGAGHGQGKNFVDADKNGVCDNQDATVKQ